MIHPTAEVSDKAKIGQNTKIWHHVHIRENAVIGNNCNIGKNVYIDCNVTIGNNVKIQNNVNVYDADIEDDVFIGPGACFTNDMYPRAFIWDHERRGKKTIVRKGASIGTNATLLSGIEIGKFAMVGAGSVVTKNVPAYALVFGVPAEIRGYVCECGNKLHNGQNNENSVAFTCGQCKKDIVVEKSK